MYNKKVNSTLRDNIVSLFVTVIAITAIIAPLTLIYAASSNYSFTMTYSVVDGCDNGQYHTLDAGTGYIAGSAYAPNSSLTINYELEREVWGPNPSYGDVNGGINQSFTGTFSSTLVSDSNYCLVVWRNGFDAITVNGSGTLYN